MRYTVIIHETRSHRYFVDVESEADAGQAALDCYEAARDAEPEWVEVDVIKTEQGVHPLIDWDDPPYSTCCGQPFGTGHAEHCPLYDQ